MRVSDFDYDLPGRFIAQRPAVPRDRARLLAVGRENFQDVGIAGLPVLLNSGDVMVVNDTRVIPVRLKGRKDNDGPRIEATLLKPEAPGTWQALARPARKLKPGDTVVFAPGLTAEVTAKDEDGWVTLKFPLADADLMAALEAHGAMPLPPYIKREKGDPKDLDDYQTLFAENTGAVAAPTAGLHFTPGLLAAVEDAGVTVVRLTLHVGAGTFLPVKAEDTQDHKMHAEWGEITAETANAVNAAKAAGGRVVAVGSTALRLLETAASEDGGEDGTLGAFSGETDIFITPGYRFRITDALLTNFHLPRSTLFMLVAAFSGLERMKAAYEHAKAADYRFYSYGDACFLEKFAEES